MESTSIDNSFLLDDLEPKIKHFIIQDYENIQHLDPVKEDEILIVIAGKLCSKQLIINNVLKSKLDMKHVLIIQANEVAKDYCDDMIKVLVGTIVTCYHPDKISIISNDKGYANLRCFVPCLELAERKKSLEETLYEPEDIKLERFIKKYKHDQLIKKEKLKNELSKAFCVQYDKASNLYVKLFSLGLIEKCTDFTNATKYVRRR